MPNRHAAEQERDKRALLAASLAYDATGPFDREAGDSTAAPAIPYDPSHDWWQHAEAMEPVRAFVDQRSGFKGVVLDDHYQDIGPVRYYSIAGTEISRLSFVDVVAACSGGRVQATSPAALAFIEDALGWMESTGGRTVVTGQSLGGGVAQPLAWRLAKLLPENARDRMEMVTWGAPGMLDVTRSLAAERAAQGEGPDFDPRIVAQVRTRNYFVESDAVARIGDHLGETWAIPVTDLHRQRMDTFWAGAKEGRFGLSVSNLSEAYDALQDTPIGLHFIPGIMRAIEEYQKATGAPAWAKPAHPSTLPGSNAALTFGAHTEAALRHLTDGWLHKAEAGLQSLLFGEKEEKPPRKREEKSWLERNGGDVMDWLFGEAGSRR